MVNRVLNSLLISVGFAIIFALYQAEATSAITVWDFCRDLIVAGTIVAGFELLQWVARRYKSSDVSPTGLTSAEPQFDGVVVDPRIDYSRE